MKRFVIYFVAAVIFAACSKEEFQINAVEKVKNPYAVTPNEAVDILKSALDDESTRSVSIGKIKTLSMRDFVPATRSSEDTDLIYVVDLENGGSAIMGADRRMESIYAILDETKISSEKLTMTTTRSAEQDEDIEDFVVGMLNNKIRSDASTLGFREFEIDTTREYFRPVETYWTETEYTHRQAPLLNTKWHQYEPYNNSCPMRDNGYERCLAGCGAIAVSQIMYYNRLSNTISGITFDWDLISEYEYGYDNPSVSATNEVADFIHQIGNAMGADYNEDSDETGTSTTKESARNLLLMSGYSNATIVDYSLSSVVNMVDYNQKPVFIRGTDLNGSNGHAWVIDGCKIYNVEYWVRFYITQLEYEDVLEDTKYYNLVHCNYGGGGTYDGYYTSGLFNTTIPLSTDKVDASIGDVIAKGKSNWSRNLYLICY